MLKNYNFNEMSLTKEEQEYNEWAEKVREFWKEEEEIENILKDN